MSLLILRSIQLMSEHTFWEQNNTGEVNYNAVHFSTIAHAKIILNQVGILLEKKNKAYGDSALSPVKIFSNLDGIDALKVQIDHKLKRIQNAGITDQTEDTLLDLIGYLTLLAVAIDRQSK